MTMAQAAEDRRLATLHLRLGGLALARAELEDLQRRGELDAPGLADLAEARWRSGDLEVAADAAIAHLGAGGSRPIARVIAAEAAAAAGRPLEARVHVDALGQIEAEALDHLFAGMPRRAHWPSAPGTPVGPAATMFDAERAGAGRPGPRPLASTRTGTAAAPAGDPAPAHAAGSTAGPPPGGTGTEHPSQIAGPWADDEPSFGGRAGAASRGAVEPAEELARARAELAAGDAVETARGLARLALVLRLDPALAAVVLGTLGPHRQAAALLVRGDACRILGRHLEAEAAFAAAARALDAAPSRSGPS